MTEPTIIRYEATKILPDILSGDLAMLTVQTKEGRIAVYMNRTVFADLFREMQHALYQGPRSDRSR
jgi:hypothetical protein